MYQIGLKDTDLTKLKQQIKELEEEKEKEEQRRKEIDKKCQELTQQNAKLGKQVVGNMALWGARHLIWDQIIIESSKLRPFLEFCLKSGKCFEKIQEEGFYSTGRIK